MSVSPRFSIAGLCPLPQPGRGAAGFSRFELLVSVALIGVLAAVLLDYSLRFQERAEKAVMEATVAHIRSGLRVRIAELMLQERTAEIGNLQTENPVNWLEKPPANYLGQIDAAGQNDIPKGSWYFDASSRELVYLPKLHRFLQPESAGERGLRFRVTAKRRITLAGAQQYEGMDFKATTKYLWF